MGRQVSKRKRRLAEEDEETVREDYVQKMRDSYPLIIRTLMHDLIVSIDKDGDIVFLNDAAVEFWDKPSEEIIGTHFSDYMYPEDMERTLVALQEMIKSKGQVKGFIVRVKSPRGARKVAWNAVAIVDEAGNYVGTQATGKDLTDLLRTEEELKWSQRHFQRLFEVMVDPVVIVDMNGKILELSQSAEEILGFPREELVGKHFMETDVVTDKSKAIMMKNLEKMKKGKYISPYIIEAVTKDGKKLLYEAASAKLMYKGESAILGIFHNITEQRKAEEKLQASEERFKYFLENAPEAIWVQDLVGTFLDGNKRAEELTGYNREELIGKNMLEMNLVPSEYIPIAMEAFKANKPGEISGPHELELIRKDGSLVSIEASTIPVERNGKIEIIGIARDITDRKRAEKELIRLSSAVRISNDSIVISDLDGTISDVNEATLKMYGTDDKSDLIGTIAFDLVVPEERKKALAAMKELLEKGYLPNREYNVIAKDGSKIPVEMSTAIMKDANGKPIGFVSISRDITERKRAVESLKESEEKYRAIINAMNDTAWVIDFDGKFLDVNDAAVKVMGYSREELLSMGPTDIDNALTPEQIMGLVKGMKSDEVQNFETAHTTKDGKTFPVEISSSLVTYHGKPAILSIARDITDRKKTENELKESEEKFRAIFEGATDGILALDPETQKIAFANPRLSEITGYPLDELRKLGIADLHRKEDLPYVMDQFKKLMARKVTHTRDIPFLRKDKTTIYCNVSSTLLKIGNQQYIVAFLSDITEQKRAEEKLRQSEERYRTVFENTGTAMCILEEDKTISMVNRRFEELSGYSWKELEGKKWTEFVTKEYLERMKRYHEARRKKGGKAPKHYSFDFVKKNGQIRNVLLTIDLIPGTKKSVASILDITERKRAEKELIRLSSAVRVSNDSIVITDLDGTVLDVNEATLKMYGSDDKSDLIGTIAFDLVVPEEREKALAGMKEVLEKGQIPSQEYNVLAKDGSEIPVEMSTAIMKDADGKPIGFVAISRDITERKKAEEALKESEKRFRELSELLPEIVFETDVTGELTFVNKAALDYTGYSQEDFDKGLNALQMIVPEDRDNAKKSIGELLSGKNIGPNEYTALRKDGSTFPIIIHSNPITRENRVVGMRGIIVDITERKKTENELKESEEKFRTIFEGATDGILAADPETFKFVFTNPRMHEIVGYPGGELLNLTIADLVRKEDVPFAIDQFKKQLEGKVTSTRNVPILRKDKTIVYCDISSNLMEIGEKRYLVGFFRDVTEQKKTEEKIQNLAKFHSENPNPVFRIAKDGAILDANKAAQTLRRELERKKNQLVPPLLRKTVRASLRSGLGKKVEVKYSDRIFSFVVAPVTEAGYVNIYGREITERKKIEKELRNSEERFRQVVENAEEWIWEVDAKGLYTYSSPVVEKMLGYKPEELVGKKHFYDLFHPEDKEELKKIAFQGFAEKSSFRDFINRNVHKNGNIVWLSTSGVPILDDESNLLGYRGADLNVTEQKKAEEALRRSEEEAIRLLEFQNKVIDTATVWVNLVDLKGNVILWNRAAELISGYSREEIIGHKKMWKWLYPDPDYRAKFFAVGKEILDGRKRLEDFESTIRCKDGSIKTISWYATNVLDEKGKPAGSIAVGIDITEQKRVEEALRESEEKYRELLNGMNDTAWVIDFDGNIIDVNDAAVEVMGYSREEFRSIGLTGIDSNLDPEEIKSLVENMPVDETQVFETEHTTKDGKKIPVEISSSLVTYKGKQAILSIARDITERKKAQEAIKEANRLLKQSNKELESYTYAVSHDLKAPLRTIRSFGSFLLEDYGDKLNETGQDYLQRMVNASSHMNAMIEDLLTLSHVGRKFTEFEKVDLNKLLEEIQTDLEATIKERNAEVVVDKLPTLSVQRVWMRQLFMNLINNGLKFNESKTPKIEVLYKERESDHLFKVRDNGIGIEEKYLERIFNLFDRALTEKKYEGTGAGLAICKKIVEQIGGEIWVESTPGKGSTFMFTIPKEIKQEKEA